MTIFTKIINREIPADIVYETDEVLAFKDINPQAPVHILVIPKKEIVSISEMSDGDVPLIGTLMQAVTKIAAQESIKDYRLVINNGAGAGQTVFHLHVHLMAARAFTWPAG